MTGKISYVKVEMKWEFVDNGQRLRSSSVGSYWAEIHKSRLIVVSDECGGSVAYQCRVNNRSHGIQTAARVISKLLADEYEVLK